MSIRHLFLQHFQYDETTGHLYWIKKTTRTGPNVVGKRADRFHKHKGCRIVTLLGKQYKAHRVIWSMMIGEPPPDIIDHIDGDQENNKLTNLRAADPSLSASNISAHRDKYHDLPVGVNYRPEKGTYRVKMQAAHAGINVEKYFATAEEAIEYSTQLRASIGVRRE